MNANHNITDKNGVNGLYDGSGDLQHRMEFSQLKKQVSGGVDKNSDCYSVAPDKLLDKVFFSPSSGIWEYPENGISIIYQSGNFVVEKSGANNSFLDVGKANVVYQFSGKRLGDNLILDYGGTEDVIDISSFGELFETKPDFFMGRGLTDSIFLSRDGDHLSLTLKMSSLRVNDSFPVGKITVRNHFFRNKFQIESLRLSAGDKVIEQYNLVELGQRLLATGQQNASLTELLNGQLDGVTELERSANELVSNLTSYAASASLISQELAATGNSSLAGFDQGSSALRVAAQTSVPINYFGPAE